LVGQDLIDLTNLRLAGLSNGVSDQALVSYINEAKDEIWAALKEENDEYFMQSTQTTDATQLNYFPRDLSNNALTTLSTTSRSYLLPTDLREIKFIEVTTKGYEQTVFVYKNITDSDFKSARRSASVDPTLTPSTEYFYTILGKNRFELAQFPETQFAITLWYIRSLPDFEASDSVDEILLPYSKKIADYASKKAVLGMQDPGQFAMWTQEWKADLVTVMSSASPRNQADAQFVEDFLG
jgi:hypothetical protein